MGILSRSRLWLSYLQLSLGMYHLPREVGGVFSNGEWDPGLPEKSGKIFAKTLSEKGTHHMSASPLWESLSTLPNYIWQDTFWLMVLGILPGSNWPWQERNNPSGPATHLAVWQDHESLWENEEERRLQGKPIGQVPMGVVNCWDVWTWTLKVKMSRRLGVVHFLPMKGTVVRWAASVLSGSKIIEGVFVCIIFSGLLYLVLP